jgi:hypothetical protein
MAHKGDPLVWRIVCRCGARGPEMKYEYFHMALAGIEEIRAWNKRAYKSAVNKPSPVRSVELAGRILDLSATRSEKIRKSGPSCVRDVRPAGQQPSINMARKIPCSEIKK